MSFPVTVVASLRLTVATGTITRAMFALEMGIIRGICACIRSMSDRLYSELTSINQGIRTIIANLLNELILRIERLQQTIIDWIRNILEWLNYSFDLIKERWVIEDTHFDMLMKQLSDAFDEIISNQKQQTLIMESMDHMLREIYDELDAGNKVRKYIDKEIVEISKKMNLINQQLGYR